MLLLAELALVGWLGCGLLYVWLLHELLQRPAGWNLARRLVCRASGARWHGTDGIVFQQGPFGCAPAALQMLLASRGLSAVVQPVCGGVGDLGPLTMTDMSGLMGQVGLTGKGYEFSSLAQMGAFLAGGRHHGALLLQRVTGSPGSLHRLLTLPTQLAYRVAMLLRHGGQPVFHWVLFESLSPDEVVIRDPFLGRVGWRHGRFQRIWTGYGLVAQLPDSAVAPEAPGHAVA